MPPDQRRGRLKIYLGAAPGVGKTYAMLGEGHRRAERGVDVVVGVVDSHGRPRTAAQLAGLEQLATPGGGLDLDRVLTRAPAVVLVDELARRNPPGADNAERWRDVEVLLAAGIDVVSTLNVQELESLADSVTAITGRRPDETVPDDLVRRAEQIELVDMSPEALRRRLAHGNVYPPERVDAALASYFRVGNLTALRELALLWLADRVDEGLARYRSEHGIDGSWPARERIVVALTGAETSDALVRRASRIAGRSSGAELLAVHVAAREGARGGAAAHPVERLEAQRLLVESLGGSFHTVLGEDVAEAVVAFARGVNATQVVLGTGRGSRVRRLFLPDTSRAVIRRAGDLDVVLVAADEGRAGRRPGPRRLPRPRLLAGVVLAVAGPCALVALLSWIGGRLTLPSQLLLMLALTVGVAILGGLWPALVSAVLGSLLINYYFTPPLHALTIARVENALALVIFVAVAVAVATVVDVSARRRDEAVHSRAEAATLSTLAGTALRGGDSIESLLERLRSTFTMTSAALYERADDRAAWVLVSSAGVPPHLAPGSGDVEAPASDGLTVVLRGHPLPAGDTRVLQAYATHIGVVLERDRLTERATAAQLLEAGHSIRTALLAAVSHDLRSPLAGIKAAVSSLRQEDVEWSSADEADLLATIEESADRLDSLVANLLDMSRLQTGTVQPLLRSVALDEVVPRALAGLDPAVRVEVLVSDTLPLVVADAGLLERVLANLVENAARHGGAAGAPVVVSASVLAGEVELRVVDRGPGVPDDAKESMFAPFQRLGDAPAGAGVGLGLAVARGFVDATGGRLWAEDTPGGGLTMVVAIPHSGAAVADEGRPS